MRKLSIFAVLVALSVPSFARASTVSVVSGGFDLYGCHVGDAIGEGVCVATLKLASLPLPYADPPSYTGDICTTSAVTATVAFSPSTPSSFAGNCSLQDGRNGVGSVNVSVAGGCSDWTISWDDPHASLEFLPTKTQMRRGEIHGYNYHYDARGDAWDISMSLPGFAGLDGWTAVGSAKASSVCARGITSSAFSFTVSESTT